ncbi:MAG TPA: hypothetical protein VH165_20115, partial [Kofleriaceae bacterium]|nr:hypothetical protein [Kofleriaceae bacterium]
GGAQLTISQSIINGNAGGGIFSMNSPFTIVGNIFFNNGSNTSLIGGVALGIGASTTNRLDFNSFSLNTTQDGIGPAIQCNGTFTASNNIMSNNRSATKMDQVGGTCLHTYSIARPGVVPPGTGDIASDPMFVDPSKGDLHIQATSPARHAADPAADLSGIASKDIDGDTRGARADMGADEIP